MPTRKFTKFLRLLLCMVLLFGYMPEAFAMESTDDGLCEHHTEHTDDCDYSPGSECTHQHTDQCYEEVVTWLCDNNDHIHSENCPHTTERVLHCKHVHDELCGYAEATPCGYLCETCDKEQETKEGSILPTENVQATNGVLQATSATTDNSVASVNGEGYDTLTEAYTEAAKNKGTIVLLKDITDCNYLTIDSTVTVDLNNHSITPKSGQFAFYILESGYLTITGTGNVNGGDYGYGIVWNKGTMKMEDDVVLQNNDSGSSGWGGAVYNQGTFIMNGGTIQNTFAGSGGGAICNMGGTVTMNGGTITKTSTTWYGGAICNWKGTFNMDGGKIIDTTASYNGGAIYNSATFTMTGGQITNCKTTSTSGYGGAIYNKAETMTMNDGTISNCETQYGGGGIHVEGGSFTMHNGTIENCKTTDSKYNWSEDKASNGGGGVSVRTNAAFTMNGGLIRNNASLGGDAGGGISNDGSFTMNGGQIIMNDATNGEGFAVEGGGVYNNGNMTMSAGMIANNKGQGGIWSGHQNSTLTITGGAVFDNYALEIFGQSPSEDDKKVDIVINTNHWTNDGASICAASDLSSDEAYGYTFAKWYYIGEGWSYADKLVQTEFDSAIPSDQIAIQEDNTHAYFRAVYDAPEVAEKEGIYLNGSMGSDKKDGTSAANAVLTFDKAWELANAELNAGKDSVTIYVCGKVRIADAKTWGEASAKNIIIKRADGYVGALAEVTTTGQLTLRNITIDGNKQTDYTDSMIHVKGGKILIQDGTVLQNNLSCRTDKGYDGGAIFIERGSGEMTGGTIQNNIARNNGGGVSVSLGTFTMSGGTITDNTAVYGGGISAVRGTDIEITGNATISNNSAYHGGGVNIGGYSTADCYSGHVDHNPQTLTMSGGTLSDNRATAAGGGIFIQMNSTATITEGTITGNRVDGGKFVYHGGGIYVNGGKGASWSQIDPADGDLVNSIPDGRLQLYNTEISGNKANEYGGALAGCPTADVKIYVTDGAVLYNNSTLSGSTRDVYVAKNQDGATNTYVSDFMLGGGMYQWFWRNPDKQIRAEQSQYQNTSEEVVLSGVTAMEDVEKALTLATVHITDNQAPHGHGGGIATNGIVIIGTPDETTAEITIFKSWDDSENKYNTRPANIKLDIRYGDYTLRGIELTKENNWTTTLEQMPNDILTQNNPAVTVLEYDGGVYTLSDVKADVQGDTLTIRIENTYTHPTGNLTVSKTVTGAEASTTKEFTFTVTLDDTTINGTYGDMTFTNGVATFTLTADGSKTASGLPSGVHYTVQESDNKGYLVTVNDEQVTKAEGVVVANETITVAFNNHKSDVPETGDHTNTLLYMILALLSLVAMGISGLAVNKSR